jgi:ferredoxin-NADP reductase
MFSMPKRQMREDFDATGHVSLSPFDEVGVPRDTDVYLWGPTRFMADMKEALTTLGVPPERIHIEIFNSSESMSARCRQSSDASSASTQVRRQHRPAGIVRAQRHRCTHAMGEKIGSFG